MLSSLENVGQFESYRSGSISVAGTVVHRRWMIEATVIVGRSQSEGEYFITDLGWNFVEQRRLALRMAIARLKA